MIGKILLGGGLVGGRILFAHGFDEIISVDNLLEAWREFLKGKRGRADVEEFSLHLMDNILSLRRDLAEKTYQHSSYHAFAINDPKPRSIHKAEVRDRLLHRAIYRELYPFFDKTFIADSFSCRKGKGTHKALNRFRDFGRKVSKNNTRTCWVLKCDIRKFFENIDHDVLMKILGKYIPDADILWLLERIIKSFHSRREDIGLPLGNLTSQLFVNIYMNEFDQFAKHRLKAKYYIRYADDFVVFSRDRNWLESLASRIQKFLHIKLRLELHPDKLSIKTLASGVDFLGWVHFPDHKVLRTATKKRMFLNLQTEEGKERATPSYLGLLRHGNARKLQRRVVALTQSEITRYD